MPFIHSVEGLCLLQKSIAAIATVLVLKIYITALWIFLYSLGAIFICFLKNLEQ